MYSLKWLVIILLFSFAGLMGVTLTLDDLQFCYDRELWQIGEEYLEDIEKHLRDDSANNLLYDILEEIAYANGDTLAVIAVIKRRAVSNRDFYQINRLVNHFQTNNPEKSTDLLKELQDFLLEELKPNRPENTLIEWLVNEITTEEMLETIAKEEIYPSFFEDYIKRLIDDAAVERDGKKRLENSRAFIENYPNSEWVQAAKLIYFRQLLNKEKFEAVKEAILADDKPVGIIATIYARILADGKLRKAMQDELGEGFLLDRALELLEQANNPEEKEQVHIFYQKVNRELWDVKLAMLKAKLYYYKILESQGYWGDEETVIGILDKPDENYTSGWNLINSISIPDNDFGDTADHNFWLGKYSVLTETGVKSEKSAEYFIDCLIAGAPRKTFDEAAFRYLEYLHSEMKIEADIMTWSRRIKQYEGPVFEDVTAELGMDNMPLRRVAIGDYNNNGRPDVLLEGRLLYRNDGSFSFTDVTEAAGIINHSFVGGLWADFDKDGKLDFVSISHSLDEKGNTLYRNMGDGTFRIVNEERGAVNDFSPTEGAAWIDFELTGFPSLYMANYETWVPERVSGFKDFFFYNERGFFQDKSEEFGFYEPNHTINPGLAGRGVSPADFNNDGRQSIFVSNYRLARNFVWEWDGNKFRDNAALDFLQGHKQLGYYGHTIGAVWGDYNNNGRLDLFKANLAHPRYIEFSDISMLLRNDGPRERVLGRHRVAYHHFTDVTAEAGIAFDELHADPNWFDANNNGFLDLYITSVYENDRSYFYLNNGDGTFTDVTWLSGTRVFNGWGNAASDLDGNQRLDLVVGSGNAFRVFRNVTENNNSAVFYKPYWDGDEVKISSREEWSEVLPNSPAFGIKVQVKVKNRDGSVTTLIRELDGGKGSTSQNDQFLHFGLGEGDLIEASIWQPEEM